MKKVLTSLVCLAAAATIASADFARVELGAGMWNQTPKGSISYTDSGATGSDTSDEKEQQQAYIWLLVKHPIPILPNLRLEYAGITTNGVASGKFKEWEVPTGTSTKTTLEMTQYDVIPYYNILDNTFWMTLDLGLDLKIMNTTYKANPITGFVGYNDTTSVVMPLLYVRTRVEIPVTNIGLEADVKYISFDSNTMYDARVKVDYTLGFIPIIQPALEVGYRVQKIETDGGEDAKVDLEFSGVYAGLMLRF